MFAALVTGAAVQSVTTEPSPLDVAKSELGPNDPVARAALSTAVDHTLAFSNFTAVIRVGGVSRSKVILQAPNRVASFSPPSTTVMVAIGATTYMAQGSGCPGWVQLAGGRLGEIAAYQSQVQILTFVRNPVFSVQRISSTQFQAEAVAEVPKRFLASGTIEKIVSTIQLRDGHVVSERLSYSGASIRRGSTEEIHFYAFGSSPPVTAPPANEVHAVGTGGFPSCQIPSG